MARSLDKFFHSEMSFDDGSKNFEEFIERIKDRIPSGFIEYGVDTVATSGLVPYSPNASQRAKSHLKSRDARKNHDIIYYLQSKGFYFALLDPTEEAMIDAIINKGIDATFNAGDTMGVFNACREAAKKICELYKQHLSGNWPGFGSKTENAEQWKWKKTNMVGGKEGPILQAKNMTGQLAESLTPYVRLLTPKR